MLKILVFPAWRAICYIYWFHSSFDVRSYVIVLWHIFLRGSPLPFPDWFHLPPLQGELSGLLYLLISARGDIWLALVPLFPSLRSLVSSNFRYPLCKEFSTLLALVALFWNLTVQFFLLGYFSFSFLEPDSSGLFVALFFVYLGKFSKRWLRYFFFRSPQRVSLSPLVEESQCCWLFRSLTVLCMSYQSSHCYYTILARLLSDLFAGACCASFPSPGSYQSGLWP